MIDIYKISRRLFDLLDEERLLTGAWHNISYEDLPEHVRKSLLLVVIEIGGDLLVEGEA